MGKNTAPHHHTHLRRRVHAVTRVLGGEPVEAVAQELGVTPRDVDAWAKEFCRAGEIRLRQLPDNWFERVVTGAEKLVPLATLLSVVIAAVLFVQGQRKATAETARANALARESRVRDAYTALDDKYIQYVELCLQNKDLDVFDTPLVRTGPRHARPAPAGVDALRHPPVDPGTRLPDVRRPRRRLRARPVVRLADLHEGVVRPRELPQRVGPRAAASSTPASPSTWTT